MHDSRFYENEKKHKVAICENKHARGRPKGKGYMIATIGQQQTKYSFAIKDFYLKYNITDQYLHYPISKKIGNN